MPALQEPAAPSTSDCLSSGGLRFAVSARGGWLALDATGVESEKWDTMTHRVLVLLTLSASVALSSISLAGETRKSARPALTPSAAEPLCGGGTKNPPDGPQPPKEPPKT